MDDDALARLSVRESDLGRALGVSAFPSDLSRRDCLVGAVLRSPHAHCLVRNLDVSRARTLPGVHAILTAADIPGSKLIGKVIDDMPILVEDRARSVLDALCLIAAETDDDARAAASSISMTCERLPAVFSAEEAMQPDAPLVHANGNVIKHFKLRHGNARESLSRSDVVIESTYQIPSVEHAFMETEAALAERIGDDIRVFVGCQNPYLERELVARVLNLPERRVEIVDVHAGGGFGGKDDSLITLYVALLAWESGKPVRMVFDRRESMWGHSKRHAMTVRASTGATAEGTICAMEMEIVADTGAYAHWGPVLMTSASLGAAGPYEIPSVAVDTYVVYTNNIMAGAMRAWGNQAVAFVVESQVDQVAATLGIHPLRLRWLNALREESIMLTGHRSLPGVGARRTIEAAARHFGIDLENPAPANHAGLGFASVLQPVNLHFGHSDISEVEVQIGVDGGFEILAATSDIGQGLEAMMRLVFSRAMGGISPELVHWMPPSTATSPNAGPTGASRHTALTGNAIRGAALGLQQKIIHLAAEMMGSNPEEVRMEGGHLWDAKNEMRLTEVLAEARRRGLSLRTRHRFEAPPTTDVDENGQGFPVNQYSYSTQVAQVAVDETTGEVRVLQVDAFSDAGHIVNPLGARKQIEGGVVMGLGYALTEEFMMHEGKPVNGSLTHYLIPTVYDAPCTIESHFVESPGPFGDLGARGIAEIAMVPTAPSIINAIYDATGARLCRIPATPERVLAAMEQAARNSGAE